MQKIQNLNRTIDRIIEMEEIFDMLLEILEKNPAAVKTDVVLKEKLEKLVQYYESGLWLADFEQDERGMFPVGLKRGILSEDGIYNFLSKIQDFSQ